MEAAYASGGVGRFAAWVHESDRAMRRDLESRGYTLDTSTRAMGLSLDGILPPRPQIDLAPPDWNEHLRIVGVPGDFLAGTAPTAYHVLLAQLEGETVATAMAFDLDGDCGIYNVGTLAHARRRGLGTALTAIQLHDARTRGCRHPPPAKAAPKVSPRASSAKHARRKSAGENCIQGPPTNRKEKIASLDGRSAIVASRLRLPARFFFTKTKREVAKTFTQV